ncbi:hypothetical protein ACEZDB_08030 [Streptacidiphilus sp. N1-3]|uniref:Uncharacterized protein n=1 Tax=Streptacidiphilus alkalitolerans TaxID=3342712 RepID=A0ABV6WX50_9ACTN
MHWDTYEIFSVLSGSVWIICGVFIPRQPVKERLWAILGGSFFVGYGIYVAKQTSGTYDFPIAIFVMPVLGLLYLIGSALNRAGRSGTPSDRIR